MLKLVLDTNTFISGFLWDGNEAKLLRLIELRKAQLFISEKILNEIERVLEKEKIRQIIAKSNINKKIILQKIRELSTIVSPDVSVFICRDIDDNKFIECGIAAEVNFIITGDSDLLVLEKYDAIKMITTKRALDILLG